MLTPEYLDSLPEPVLELFRQVEEDILADMARRISKMGAVTDTADWQRWRLEQIQLIRSDITAQLSKITGLTQQELRKLFQESATQAIQADDEIYRAAGLSPGSPNDNPELLQLLNGGMRQTSGTFQNLTRTTANTATQQFERALDRAWLQVSSGAFNYQAAIRTAIKSLASTGMQAIEYPTGHIDTLEVAVRRAVLTGVGKTTGEICLAHAEEMGCDLMEITAHPGARPSHMEWQGKIVSLSGRKGYLSKSDIGYGTGNGFKGWNCRHDWFPYFEGLSETAYPREKLREYENQTVTYNGKTLSYYEATQQQRYIERQIRRWKREYLMMDTVGPYCDKCDTTQASMKLAQWRAAEKDFCKQTGLDQDGFRSQVEGFGRSEASRATWEAKKKLLSDVNLNPLPITTQSIGSVKKFPCQLLPPALQTKLQNEHKKLLISISRKPLGTEAGATYDLSMKPLHKVIGEDKAAKVFIPKEEVPHIAIHTHPTGGTFTHTDLRLFANDDNIKMLTAVGNNGKVYAVEKTAAFSKITFDLYRKSVLERHPNYLESPEKYEKYMDDFLKGVETVGIKYYTTGT